MRLGDRKESLNGDNYFDYLEDFMGNVTSAVTIRGHDSPVFHIFSETSSPCPPAEDGKFPEFPQWPVKMNQVRQYLVPLHVISITCTLKMYDEIPPCIVFLYSPQNAMLHDTS